MSNEDDFRQRYQNRAQTVKDEQAAEVARQQAARLDYAQQQSRIKQLQEQEKAELLQKQRALLVYTYQTSGMKARVEVIASIISQGKIIEEIKNEDYERGVTHKTKTTIVKRIPYHVFTGRMIIEDPNLSDPGHHVDQVGWVAGPKGQKLSESTSLSDQLIISLSIPNDSSSKDPQQSIFVQFNHVVWKEEKMYFTKALFNKTGYVARLESYTDLPLYFLNGEITSDWAPPLENVINSRFNQIYDSYLSATGQV